MKNISRNHHYVPKWHQKLFTNSKPEYYYFNKSPKQTFLNGRYSQVQYQTSIQPVSKCFMQEDLYNFNIGGLTTDEIERNFFGSIDKNGCDAIKYFIKYNGYDSSTIDMFEHLIKYMDAQRTRTPKGLDQLSSVLTTSNRTSTLKLLSHTYSLYRSMWAEGVWEIVRADRSATKFIITDTPVTFFNSAGYFKNECIYPGDLDLAQTGTRTIFTLSPDRCLIITSMSLARNPWQWHKNIRPNPRLFGNAFMDLTAIQHGRDLNESEVLKINYILKKSANKFIAAEEKEWLSPEKYLQTQNWSELDDDWFLFPNLSRVKFNICTMMGFNDGTALAKDEYGRNLKSLSSSEVLFREHEFMTFEKAKKEWALKRGFPTHFPRRTER